MVPTDMTIDDCTPFILYGIEKFYVMAGKAAQYSEDLIERDADGLPVGFLADFPLDELLYIMATAKIAFYTKVQSDVSELESYTTDAMSVANADKPFANISAMLQDLKREQVEIWHKMVRYNML